MQFLSKTFFFIAMIIIGLNSAMANDETIAISYVKKYIQKLNDLPEKEAFDLISHKPVTENPKFSVLVYDINGVIKAWSFSPSYEGRNVSSFKNLSGDKVLLDVINSSKKKPTGWYDFTLISPWTGQPGKIKSYYETFNNYIVSCGYSE